MCYTLSFTVAIIQNSHLRHFFFFVGYVNSVYALMYLGNIEIILKYLSKVK